MALRLQGQGLAMTDVDVFSTASPNSRDSNSRGDCIGRNLGFILDQPATQPRRRFLPSGHGDVPVMSLASLQHLDVHCSWTPIMLQICG